MTDILLDPEHGLNPSVYHCFYCHGEMGVALFGKLQGERAPQHTILDQNTISCSECGEVHTRDIGDGSCRICGAPICFQYSNSHYRAACDTCAGYMKKGIILIEVDEEKSTDRSNPLHAGGFAVITEEGMKGLLHGDILEDILKRRVVFVPTPMWKKLGL